MSEGVEVRDGPARVGPSVKLRCQSPAGHKSSQLHIHSRKVSFMIQQLLCSELFFLE